MTSFQNGDIVWIISDFGVSSKIIHGEIVERNQHDELLVSLFPEQITKEFYLHQQNLTFTKNKTEARLIHIAKLCRDMDFRHDLPDALNLIALKTGIVDNEQIKREIKMSQSQFPELWI